MKSIAAFIAVNLATCGVAVPTGFAAWHHIPMPGAPLAILFLSTATGGFLFVTGLWLLKQHIQP